MFRFGSLRTRIMVLTTIPLSALFVAILIGTIRTGNKTVRDSVESSLSDAGSVFAQLVTTRRDELLSMARVTVRDPRFFATFSIPQAERGPEFVPTLEGTSLDFLNITDADYLEIFDARGNFLTRVENEPRQHADAASIGTGGLNEARKGYAVTDFYRDGDDLVLAAVVPIYVGQKLEGVLRLGGYLDNRFVTDVRRLTGADVSLHDGTGEFATTFDTPAEPAWRQRGREVPLAVTSESLARSETFTSARAGIEYLCLRVRLRGVDASTGFDAFIARELAAELAPLLAFEKRMALAGVGAILVTLLVGWFLANSITRPVLDVVDAASALKQGRYDHPLETRGKDEVAYMARIFDEMRDAQRTYVAHLKDVDQVKSNFIALAGHELRTPLTIITGFNEMIMSGAMGELPSKVKETAQHIQDHLTDLNGLVQKILDLSSLEQGLLELSRENIDLRGVVQNGLSKRREAFANRHLSCISKLPDEAVTVHADPIRIEQAFLALLDNAIRFTPDGGSVAIALSTEGGQARITVKDSGIGIPPNELKFVFNKLYESEDVLSHSSGKHRFGSRGFGLGLALTRVIIEKHGGTVSAKSSVGNGSEFAISIALVDAGVAPYSTVEV